MVFSVSSPLIDNALFCKSFLNLTLCMTKLRVLVLYFFTLPLTLLPWKKCSMVVKLTRFAFSLRICKSINLNSHKWGWVHSALLNELTSCTACSCCWPLPHGICEIERPEISKSHEKTQKEPSSKCWNYSRVARRRSKARCSRGRWCAADPHWSESPYSIAQQD